MSDVVGRLRGIAGQATPGPWQVQGPWWHDDEDMEHIATFDPQLVVAMLDVIDAALELAPGYDGAEGPYLQGVCADEMQAVNDALARFRKVAS